jgi:hypothetical protein
MQDVTLETCSRLLFFIYAHLCLPFSRNGRCRKGGGWSKQAQGERRSVRANVGGFYTWRLAPPPCSSNQMSALANNEADSRAICEGKAMI